MGRTLVIPLAAPGGSIWHEARQEVDADVAEAGLVAGTIDVGLALDGDAEPTIVPVPVTFAVDIALPTTGGSTVPLEVVG